MAQAWVRNLESTERRMQTDPLPASPHVAGLSAYLMAFENINTPDDVVARIKTLAGNTGAAVLDNQGAGTTSLIANNGNL